jgi:hypothetical protein
MTLKFTVAEDMSGYSLFVDTAQITIEVGATEEELRRLMVDLLHELDYQQPDEEPCESVADHLYGILAELNTEEMSADERASVERACQTIYADFGGESLDEIYRDLQ